VPFGSAVELDGRSGSSANASADRAERPLERNLRSPAETQLLPAGARSSGRPMLWERWHLPS
jgi:hypothetical protein